MKGLRFLPAAAAVLCGIAMTTPAANGMDCPHLYYAQWANGPSDSEDFFPIAVWLQSPYNAAGYEAAGINVFVGLWEGPTEAQLSDLTAAGMDVYCHQNGVGLTSTNNAIIRAWTQDDEPDNAQPDGGGGYDPPILPSAIIANYDAMRAADSTRPVYLNLGQGAAWDNWYGRGTRTNHPEDYYEYVDGCDIASFDIYPVNSSDAEVTGNLWYVPLGIDRLRACTDDAKPVWCWIECTKIAADSAAKPTPAQVKSEVWMALIHGANGFGYFCHSWTPSFDEAALLHDAEMLAAVTELNARVQSLAAVLNSPTAAGEVAVASGNAGVPVDIMVKHNGGYTYVFAAAMRDDNTTATFTLPGATTVEVMDEGRSIPAPGGSFEDGFSGYGIHLYRFPEDMTAPAVDASDVVLSGTVSDDTACPAAVIVNGVETVAVDVTGLSGTWTAEVPLASGANDISLSAADSSGNETSAEVEVTVVP
ncbi:MAG: hypothetical protein JW909_13940 [Planctomycetes bacterium]|nr:hypothetical protein [Planctomycetota bacterium]